MYGRLLLRGLILVCFTVHLSIVTCFSTGDLKQRSRRSSHASHLSRTAIASAHSAAHSAAFVYNADAAETADTTDEELVPTVDDDTQNNDASSDVTTNEFLKKSLVEFFNGVKQPQQEAQQQQLNAQKTTRDLQVVTNNKAQKRTLKMAAAASHLLHKKNSGTRRNKLTALAGRLTSSSVGVRTGKRRHVVGRLRNETDMSGVSELRCKFPFIYDGNTVYHCLDGLHSSKSRENSPTLGKKWCSLTSNYDRDLQWTNCLDDGTPVRRSENYDMLLNGQHNGENIESLSDEVDQLISVEKRKIQSSSAIRKHETGKVSKTKEKNSDADDICETCDNLPKNNTEKAVKNMKDEIDDVEKSSEKDIHSLVSKEVDNFIGSVLTKHGVPDTEQKELLALNAKLSTELAQEVSCKLTNESIGTTRSECVIKATNKTLKAVPTHVIIKTSDLYDKPNEGKAPESKDSKEYKGSTVSNKTKTPAIGNKTAKASKVIKGEKTDNEEKKLKETNTASKKKEEGKNLTAENKEVSMATDNSLNKTIQSQNQSALNSDELLSNEVDAFISSVLSQHNISASKQRDIIKSIKKASTDIADQIDYVVSYAKAGGITNKNNIHEHPTKATTTTVFTPNSIHAAVDSFLTLVLEKHGVPTTEQKEILDWNAQLSTDIADQVNSIVEKARKGKKSHSRHSEWKSQLKEPAEKMREEEKKKTGGFIEDHLDENKNKTTHLEQAENSTAKSEQPAENSTAEQIADNSTVTREEDTNKTAAEAEKTAGNKTTHVEQAPQNETKPASDDTVQAVEKAPAKEHFNKEKKVPETGRGEDDDINVSHAGSNEASKKYDDVSSENDMEVGIDDIKLSAVNETTSEERGVAPDVVDNIVPPKEHEESISPPLKLPYSSVDDDFENMTSFANKEFNKKPQIHFKRKSLNHKKIMGDDNLDKYLLDDNWGGTKTETSASSKSDQIQNKDENGGGGGGSGENLNDDEKTMINYVSDSIISSVNNVKQTSKELEEEHNVDTQAQSKSNDVTYKKLDSGKKPYLIYRVQQQRKGEAGFVGQPGIDSIDSKSQKIIPGAKNINIIIINNKNNSLDLNDIENTIARSSEPMSEAQNKTNNGALNTTEDGANSNNKTIENLFLLINSTDKANVSQIIGETPVASTLGNSTENATKPESNATTTSGNNLLLSNQTTNETNMALNMTNFTEAVKAVNELKNFANSFPMNLLLTTNKRENTNMTDTNSTTGNEGNPRQSENRKDEKGTRNISYSKLLNEYDKDLETSTIQSLRKSGLISMNYAPEEVEVKTFGGNANGGKCMFPFIYDGDTYFNCINLNRDKPWCSTTANYDKLPVWGFCNNDGPVLSQGGKSKNLNPTVGEIQAHKAQMLHNQGEELISKHSGVKTYGGNANGAPCVIPFVYDGQTHMKCLAGMREGTSWCAASHSYDIHPVWGYCCDDNVYKC